MLSSLELQRAALVQEAADLRNKIAAAATQTEIANAQKGKLPIVALPPVSSAIQPTQPQSAEVRNWELREAVLQKSVRAVREELADRKLATLKLDSLRREAAIDKDLLDGALLRLKEQAPGLRPSAQASRSSRVPTQPCAQAFPTRCCSWSEHLLRPSRPVPPWCGDRVRPRRAVLWPTASSWTRP